MGEMRSYGLVDSGAWTDYICTTEFLGGDVEHALEVLPVANICLLEDGASRGLGGARMV